MSGGSGDSRLEEAWLTIEPSGHIVARTGVSPHGQGSETAFAQIVADGLGVTPENVRVLHGDTAVVPSGGGTGSTRGTVVGGSALYVGAWLYDRDPGGIVVGRFAGESHDRSLMADVAPIRMPRRKAG